MQYFEYTATEGATVWPAKTATTDTKAMVWYANVATTFGGQMYDLDWKFAEQGSATVVGGAVTGYTKHATR